MAKFKPGYAVRHKVVNKTGTVLRANVRGDWGGDTLVAWSDGSELLADSGNLELVQPAQPDPVADECAACGAPAVDGPAKTSPIHGEERRLCRVCWEAPSVDVRAAIYERHIKPKEQQRVNTAYQEAAEWSGEHVAEQAKADPYNPHGLTERQRLHDEAHMYAHTKSSDEEFGRRAALVANLAAEHARSAESAGLLHPLMHWSGRRGGRRRG